MNVRFEPIQLLDVDKLRYCEFCSQATFSDKVHEDPSCILDDLNLVSSSTSHTKTLNYEFYQCFLKNCTAQVKESADFSSHLTNHGIWLEETRSKYRYKCEKCSYKTTRQRYLDNHKETCSAPGDSSSSEDESNEADKNNEAEKNNEADSCSSNLRSKLLDVEGTSNSSQVPKQKVAEQIPKEHNINHRYRCTDCHYSTTQARYLASHHVNYCHGEAETAQPAERTPDSSVSAPASSTPQMKAPLKLEMASPPQPRKPSEFKIRLGKSNSAPQSPDTSDNEDQDGNENAVPQRVNKKYTASGRLTCSNCNYSTTQERYLERHNKACAGSNSKVLSCNTCSYDAQNTWTLKVHMQSHRISQSGSTPDKFLDVNTEPKPGNDLSTEAPGVLSPIDDISNLELHKCTDCSFKTKNVALFELHIKSCISNKGKRDSIFKQKKAQVLLRRVMLTKDQAKVGMFNCSLCSFTGTTKVSLNMHKLAAHCKKAKKTLREEQLTKEKCTELSTYIAPKLQCSFCPYKAKFSIMVKHHERKCSSTLYKNWKCRTCSDVLTSREKFDRHILNCKSVPTSTEHEKPKKIEERRCKRCSYHANTKVKFAMHQNLCGIPGLDKFRCEKCNHLSRYITGFNNHVAKCKFEASNTLHKTCSKCSYRPPNRLSSAIHASLCGKSIYNSNRCQSCHFIAKVHSRYLKHKTICKVSGRVGRKQTKKCLKCSGVIPMSSYCRHKQRCGNPLFEAFKCPYVGCFYIGKSDASMKAHHRQIHGKVVVASAKLKVSQPSVPNVSRPAISKGVRHSCVICPFFSKHKMKTERHMALCRARKNGCKIVDVCKYSDCFFLAKNGHGMKTHLRVVHSESPETSSCPKVSSTTSVTQKPKSLEMKASIKRANMLRYKNRHKCKLCPYSRKDNRPVMSHQALCALRKNGVSGIIACEYPDCYFLSDSTHGYNVHLGSHPVAVTPDSSKMIDHDVSKGNARSLLTGSPQEQNVATKSSFSGSKKKPKKMRKLVRFNCDKCPYSCLSKMGILNHKLMCARKLKGDKLINACRYSGCYYLTAGASDNGMKIHEGKYHQQAITNDEPCQNDVVEENVETEMLCNETEDATTNSSQVAVCDATSLQHLFPKQEPTEEDYYTCDKCSYKCFQSDVAQIQSHREHCRTQLFDKFKLPLVSPSINETSLVKSNIGRESQIKINTEAILPKAELVSSDIQQPPHDTCGPEAALPTAKTPELVPTTHVEGESSQENEIIVSKPSEPANSVDNIFDSDELDDLDLCLDSEYFI